MARRRRYTRTVSVTKTKWASHLFDFNTNEFAAGFIAVEIAKNSDQTQVPITSIIKTGNFKVNVSVKLTQNEETRQGYSCIAVIIYTPEGITLPTGPAINELMMKHPEWVMAVKYRSYQPNDAQTNQTINLEVSSRLKRNLNSGDKVMFCVYCPDQPALISAQGIVRFWTRFN